MPTKPSAPTIQPMIKGRLLFDLVLVSVVVVLVGNPSVVSVVGGGVPGGTGGAGGIYS